MQPKKKGSTTAINQNNLNYPPPDFDKCNLVLLHPN